MSTSDNPKPAEKVSKEKEQKEAEDVGFLGKVKGFMLDIGERLEGTIGFGKPNADFKAVVISDINHKQADLVIDVLVSNPNPTPIPLLEINYFIQSDEKKLASGLIHDAGTIQARGAGIVKIPLTLIYDDIKKTYADIQPGTILPYKVKVDLVMDVPVFGRVTLPLQKTGEIPVPYKPEVHIEKIKFEKFSFEETVAILDLKLDNKNDFDLGLNALDYEVWLGDVSIGGAELTKSVKIVKNDTSELDIPLTFRPKDCGSAIWDMIRGKGTGYSIKGNINVDTPFGEMKLPIERECGTTTFKKDKDDEDDDHKK